MAILFCLVFFMFLFNKALTTDLGVEFADLTKLTQEFQKISEIPGGEVWFKLEFIYLIAFTTITRLRQK